MSRPKIDGLQRTVTVEETYRRAKPVAEALGVTRLADVTGLDRVGIPVYCAIVPKSADGLSVSSGKGVRSIDAKTGALMEAIERQTASMARPALTQGSFQDLQETYNIVDPYSLVGSLADDYSTAETYSWVWGEDLVSNQPTLVPASFACYLRADDPCRACFDVSTSNGIAAGNCREEAICQGLCELIERDCWTMAELGAKCLPWARLLAGGGASDVARDNSELFASLEVGEEPLLDHFHAAGLCPVLHDITSNIGIPTIFAAVSDEMLPGFPMVHCGLGTHLDARVALRRAITEVAQSRCIDIQGVREDLVSADASSNVFALHTRRVSGVDRDMWCLQQSSVSKAICEMNSFVSSDVCTDMEYLLLRLRSRGLSQVIVVDFHIPESGFSTVRVIVPGLESWAVNRGKVGFRALEYWKTCA